MKFLSANARLITLLLLLFVASTDGFATGPTILGYPGTRQIFNQPATSCPAVLRPNALVGPRMKMEPEGTVKKIKSGWNTAIPAGDPTALPPQWVSSKPKPIQAATFCAAFAAILAGTKAMVKHGLPALEPLLPSGWYTKMRSSWPSVMGLFYALVGFSHFTNLKDTCNICPGKGAWGFWYVPGNASLHVKWTGIAEIVGGCCLAAVGLGVPGAADLAGGLLLKRVALGLFALTVAVTPANIYMFTHGAELPPGCKLPVWAHVVRGGIQSLFLSILWTIAH